MLPNASRSITNPSISLRLIPSLALLSLVLLTGCDGVAGLNDSNTPSFSEVVSHETLTAESPQTQEIAQGQYGDLEDGAQVVVRTQEEFATLWEQLHAHRDPIPEQPNVNFGQEVVVAVVMDSQLTGGYSVNIDEALLSDDGDAAQIRYTEVSPGENCNVTMAATSPYVLASVDALADNVTFSGFSKVRSCGTSE
jgi:hypothetical protein